MFSVVINESFIFRITRLSLNYQQYSASSIHAVLIDYFELSFL